MQKLPGSSLTSGAGYHLQPARIFSLRSSRSGAPPLASQLLYLVVHLLQCPP
jgi:hypothetical protein